MRFAREGEGDRVGFVVRDVPDAYAGAVRDLGFGEVGGERDGFVRWFPADAEGVDEAFATFRGVAERIIRQTAGFDDVPWDDALLRFLERVSDRGVDWWLAGSGALAVRGIAVVPRDLDLIADRDGARRLGELLRDHLVEPCVPLDGWIGEWWGRAFLGARVEWVGGVRPEVDEPEPSDFGPVAAGQLETVEWRGHRLRVPPVALSRAVSLRRGLDGRVATVDGWIGQGVRNRSSGVVPQVETWG